MGDLPEKKIPQFLPLDNTSVINPPTNVKCGVCQDWVYRGKGVQAFIPFAVMSARSQQTESFLPAIMHANCWKGDR